MIDYIKFELDSSDVAKFNNNGHFDWIGKHNKDSSEEYSISYGLYNGLKFKKYDP